MEVKILFALKEQVAEGLWFCRADGVMLKTTGRSAPLFYDLSFRVRVFKHEVVVFDRDYARGSKRKIYFTNLDAHASTGRTDFRRIHFTAQILGKHAHTAHEEFGEQRIFYFHLRLMTLDSHQPGSSQ